MKRIRGFGYVGDVDPYEDYDEEWEESEDLGLEHGYASEYKTHSKTVQAYNCPRCKRVLFEADVTLHGVIFIKCRRCRREVAIETTPIIQPIGFINTLHTKEKHNDV